MVHLPHTVKMTSKHIQSESFSQWNCEHSSHGWIKASKSKMLAEDGFFWLSLSLPGELTLKIGGGDILIILPF
jgi:hypothetical protein